MVSAHIMCAVVYLVHKYPFLKILIIIYTHLFVTKTKPTEGYHDYTSESLHVQIEL